MIRIDYERDGIRRAFHGEIDENKLNELSSEEENFIYLTNDGQGAWIDKKAILGFFELETKSTVYERNGMGASTFATKRELRIIS